MQLQSSIRLRSINVNVGLGGLGAAVPDQLCQSTYTPALAYQFYNKSSTPRITARILKCTCAMDVEQQL
jgi:hypothetical protein